MINEIENWQCTWWTTLTIVSHLAFDRNAEQVSQTQKKQKLFFSKRADFSQLSLEFFLKGAAAFCFEKKKEYKLKNFLELSYGKQLQNFYN